MKLSIVIPTRNRKEKLEALFGSIIKQKANPNEWELLVIDNGSTDDIRLLCEEWKDRFKNFIYIFDDRPGLHVGRNRGLKDSHGEVIAYLDDDVIMFPGFIQAGLDAFEDPELMAANGSAVPGKLDLIPPSVMKYKKRKHGFEVLDLISCFWERDISEVKETCRKQIPSLLYGCNVFYRREVLESCKGFHPDGMPDGMLMYRGDGETSVARYLYEQNAKVMYFSQLSVYHMVDSTRMNKKTIEKIKYRNGISDMYTLLRDSENLLDAFSKGIKYLNRELFVVELSKSRLKGEIQLFLRYFLDSSIRKWIHKETYF